MGVIDLGLATETFWRMTPKMFFALTDRWGEANRREDARAGTIAAMVLNSQRQKANSKVWKAQDFFPSLKKRRQESQTPEEMLAVVEALNAAFGGEDQREKPDGRPSS